jgi:hypothetical protein
MTQSAMRTLADVGGLVQGMEIEPVPEIRLAGCPAVEALRATVVDPQGGEASLLWNGGSYSPARLLETWEELGYVCGVPGVHSNFRIVGHECSLRAEADQH